MTNTVDTAADNAASIPAHKVYKDLGVSLKDLKAVAAEVGIDIKAAITKLSEEEVNRIRVKMGLAPEVPPAPPTPAAAEAAHAADTARRAAQEEQSRRRSEDEARKKAEADAQQAALAAERQKRDAIGAKMGINGEHVEFIAQLFGMTIEKEADVDDATAQRTQKLEAVFKIADEFSAPPREVVRIARGIGMDVGRKGFKGLSPNESFMLRAMVKQKFTTVEERKRDVTAEVAPEYKPAPPTGNKAEAPPREETRRITKPATPGTGRLAGGQEQTRELIPERFRVAESQTGRGRRERFEVSQLAYDRPRGGGGRRRGRRGEGEGEAVEEKKPELPTGPLTVEMPLNLRALSEQMGAKTSEIMARMLKENLPPVRINDTLGKDLIEQIGILFDRQITVKEPKGAEELIAEQLEVFGEDAGVETPRAPVVTIMGHVDHGKTTLLDAIASLERAAGESGGITQHIGAFRIELARRGGKFIPVYGEPDTPENRHLRVTFIDTPGHEAFTAMRARGANVTDIAVIVVGADDGVMPQTEEAIAHARAAEVEIVVAITKIDKNDANLMKVRQQLASHNLMSPEWGGNTEICEVSSITKEGIDKLVQVLSDMSELLELKAVHDKPAVGTVLEAHRDPGRGIIATMLVREGTLHRGDVVVAGHGYGRVRSMQISRGDGLRPIDEAGPAIPLEVAGLDELPEAGSLFHGMKDVKKAAEIAAMVRTQEREVARAGGFSLEEWSRAQAGLKVKELVLVLKCDVQGSVETIRQELGKLTHEEVRIKVIHAAVGQISTNDVHLAEAAHGIVVGFHVGVDAKARELADNHNVDIRTYEIIYRLIDDLRNALAGLLAPEIIEHYEGTAEVRKVFKISKVGRIAGCMVTRGHIKRDSKLRLVRDGQVVYETTVLSLKREKDDASEVREGFECGIQLKNYDDLKEGDTIEAHRIEERKRTL